MAGGLFAINQEYFWKIGGYDEGMIGWGGENLELSFRVWRCGGSMEIQPCSHVGHIFRPFHPYLVPHDSHGINSERMARVWMDDYKRFYYIERPDLKEAEFGDISDRKALIDGLRCKSFKWFLDKIYPQKYILDEHSIAWRRLRAAERNNSVCIDHLGRDTVSCIAVNSVYQHKIQRHEKLPYDLGQNLCYYQRLTHDQYFTMSKEGQLRNEFMCGEVDQFRKDKVGEIFNMKLKLYRVNCFFFSN